MMMLDSLVRYMNLMTIDVEDERVIRWPETTPPIVPRPWGASPTSSTTPTPDACGCIDQTLGHRWPLAATTVPSWVSTPGWPDGLPESEIQKEECRRLIWSSIQLLAAYNSYSVARGTQVVKFALCKASNVSSVCKRLRMFQTNLLKPQYAFLLPGEIAVGPRARDTVWNIYFRAMVLWNGCIGMRGEVNVSDSVQAKYAMTTWMESCELDDLLDKHTCDTERAFIFIGREYLYK